MNAVGDEEVNCAVSPWGACSVSCGGGTQMRSVTTQPSNGGAACPALSQPCNTHVCPSVDDAVGDEEPQVNCVVSRWSDCSATCGGGTQTRTVITPPSKGGAECPALSQPCNTYVCPSPPSSLPKCKSDREAYEDNNSRKLERSVHNWVKSEQYDDVFRCTECKKGVGLKHPVLVRDLEDKEARARKGEAPLFPDPSAGDAVEEGNKPPGQASRGEAAQPVPANALMTLLAQQLRFNVGEDVYVNIAGKGRGAQWAFATIVKKNCSTPSLIKQGVTQLYKVRLFDSSIRYVLQDDNKHIMDLRTADTDLAKGEKIDATKKKKTETE